ncbi:MAG TPA: selenocysteine-specific translation elongation factor [Tepidiformaceae bacterium]|nr:selenocysteine-specific translation elongation factor [Tepidiformaceae bacterium]
MPRPIATGAHATHIPKAPLAKRTVGSTHPGDQPRLRTVTIGTAGHVDHGKSSLVKVLTGIDPDTLPEEKAREMTIALGFAPLSLPSGRLLNVVDVPGHDSLVRTMAKGAQGMDAVLLCIACNERVMPQTCEHLDILRLLGIQRGLVVLTKGDLIDDADDRLLAEEAVRDDLRGTVLQDARCVWTSSRTREGLGTLVETLDRLVADLPPRDDAAPVRMPVDRAFVIKGFGTVVTGTLLQGTLRPGQQLVLLPQGTEVRVRTLQIQKEDVAEALAGERPAVNLAGVDAADVPTGSTLVNPRAFETTTRFLAELTLLARARPIERRTELELLGGTTLSHGRARIHVPRRTLRPGENATAELMCENPLVLVHGDLVLVRDVASNTTVGRARVLDPHPPERVDFRAAAAIQHAPSRAEAAAVIIRTSGAAGVSERELARKIGLTPRGLLALIHGHKTLWTRDALTEARENMIKAIPAPGARIPLATWLSACPIRDEKILRNLTQQLTHLFQLRIEGEMLITPRRRIRPARGHAAAQQMSRHPLRLRPVLLARVERYLRSAGIVSVSRPGAIDGISEDGIQAAIAPLVASNRLVALGRHYVIHRDALRRLERQLRPPTTARAVAAALGASRTQAHALLSHLLRSKRLSFAAGQYIRRGAHIIHAPSGTKRNPQLRTGRRFPRQRPPSGGRTASVTYPGSGDARRCRSTSTTKNSLPCLPVSGSSSGTSIKGTAYPTASATSTLTAVRA